MIKKIMDINHVYAQNHRCESWLPMEVNNSGDPLKTFKTH